jgi:4-amino-4-deoxy-L-arabinose transferase-like glycosyltransferase
MTSNPGSRTAKIASWCALAALLALVAALIGTSLDEVKHQPDADEGYYLLYARTVAERGWGAYPGLFRDWIDHEHNWIYPPPSRIAFVAAATTFVEPRAPDAASQLVAISWLSLAAHLATVAVVFAFVQRHRGAVQALLVAALTAFSPLYLGLSRLALSDSFITLWQVASLALFFEAVLAPQRRLWSVLFAVAFTVAILAKEISVLLAVPCAGWLLIERSRGRRDLGLVRFAVVLAAPVLASALLWVVAAGGFEPLRRTFEIVMASPASNVYAQRFGAGPWYRYVVDELLASPWPTALGLLSLAVVAWRWRMGQYEALLVFAALVYVAQIALLASFTKNLRYVAVLEFPLRLLAVAALIDVLRMQRREVAHAVAAALVAALCWSDWASYRLIFVKNAAYDPMSVQLLWSRDMLPPPQGVSRG